MPTSGQVRGDLQTFSAIPELSTKTWILPAASYSPTNKSSARNKISGDRGLLCRDGFAFSRHEFLGVISRGDGDVAVSQTFGIRISIGHGGKV
jgi:hypothetical protein